jgi:hypothetical protein
MYCGHHYTTGVCCIINLLFHDPFIANKLIKITIFTNIILFCILPYAASDRSSFNSSGPDLLADLCSEKVGGV